MYASEAKPFVIELEGLAVAFLQSQKMRQFPTFRLVKPTRIGLVFRFHFLLAKKLQKKSLVFSAHTILVRKINLSTGF